MWLAASVPSSSSSPSATLSSWSDRCTAKTSCGEYWALYSACQPLAFIVCRILNVMNLLLVCCSARGLSSHAMMSQCCQRWQSSNPVQRLTHDPYDLGLEDICVMIVLSLGSIQVSWCRCFHVYCVTGQSSPCAQSRLQLSQSLRVLLACESSCVMISYHDLLNCWVCNIGGQAFLGSCWQSAEPSSLSEATPANQSWHCWRS